MKRITEAAITVRDFASSRDIIHSNGVRIVSRLAETHAFASLKRRQLMPWKLRHVLPVSQDSLAFL